MCTTIIRYSIEELNKIGNGIDSLLSQNIIDNLMEIKLNNKFIKRSTPLQLEYSINTKTSEQWRNEKKEEKLSEQDAFDEKINSNLNKITNKNFDIISKIILDIINQYKGNLEYMNRLLNIIFNKSINHPTYTKIYSKLCVKIIEVVGIYFKESLIEKVTTFYKDTIIKNFEFNQNEISYDEMCKINKEKCELVGSFILIGHLYMNDLITNGHVLEYYSALLDTIKKENCKDTSHKYIECLSTLITTVSKKLCGEIGDDFEKLIISEIKLLSLDKERYKSKSRFLLQDILDLRENLNN